MPLVEEWKSWRTVPGRLRYWANRDPGLPFLQCSSSPDETSWLTYGDVEDRSDALAGALTEIGVNHGDRVAIMLSNRLEYLMTFFALARLGAIQVPLNPYLKGDFLAYQLADSAAKVLVGDTSAMNQIAPLRADLPDLAQTVTVDDVADAPAGTLAFDDLVRGGRRGPAARIEPTDLIAVMYTSGTTGRPKGCMLSQGYYFAMAWPWYQNDWLRSGDRTLTAMPLHHIGGQGIALMPVLLAGNSIAFLDRFSASGFIEAARDITASVAFGVGPMGSAMLATPESSADRDHQLRLGVFVPMAVANQDRMAERFGIDVVSETYGQTECNPITGSPIDRDPSKRASLGRPVPAMEVQLHDECGREVAEGDVGEIVMRPREAEVMFQGSWNKAEATVEASRGMWHHTGDLARADADGYLYFADRKKDSMRRRGENISSVELENAISGHSKISAVAVHAVPSPLGEDDVKAVIVMVEGESFTPEELHGFFKEKIPYFAVPRYVEFLDGLPLTPTGRVQKHLLRERDNSGAWDFEALGLTIERSQRR